ncbi:MAG TPA: MmgE/PrpD family protein [Trebonia sp.]|jgi:2-methylcitrate dehydratase PrpD|nr:MmgE/PrpD family protein [Trebonia sp.]
MTLQADAPPAAEDFAGTYADFSSSLNFPDLSEATIAVATADIKDTLACSIAGVTAEGAVEVRDLVADWGGKPEAQVLWSELRLPAPMAAWINGIMAHARDYDDVHEKAIVHAGVSSLPAAIAAADGAGRPVTGRDFYAGLVAAMELTTRMGAATTVGVIDSGFIYTSLFGYFGATAGAARVLGLSAEETRNALGIVYSQAAGGHQVTRDGAWTKRMQPGFAARAALTSTAMARRGVYGPRNIFEGADGLWRIYLRDQLDREMLRKDLGTRFHLEDLSYKPYPSCRFNHTAIDAALEIRRQPGFDWREVIAIRAYQTVGGREAVGTPVEMRQHPRTLPQAQFSICYNVACALVNGEVGVADFADVTALSRPGVAALTRLVLPLADDEIERDWGRSVSPTRLEVETADQLYTARVDFAKGSLIRPFTELDVRRKLEDCLRFGGFAPSRAGIVGEVVDGLVDSRDVAADFRKLSNEIIRK